MSRHLITGSDTGDNRLQAADSDDLIPACAGFDNINTGLSRAMIQSGANTDHVTACEDNDQTFGGDGSDALTGGDTLFGDGVDTL